jgi:hypothetical protein
MELTSFTEARNTREKLQRLEQLHEEQSAAPAENAYARELTLKSLRMMIKQLKEELARFEARVRRPEAGVEGRENAAPVHPTEVG